MKTVPEEEEEAVRIEEEEPGKAGTLKKGVASTKPTPQPRRKPGGSDRGIGYSISTAASTTSLTSRVSSGTMTDLSGITGRGFATGGGGGGNLRSIDITAGAHKYMSRPKRTEDDEPEIKFEPGDSGGTSPLCSDLLLSFFILTSFYSFRFRFVVLFFFSFFN